MYYAANEVKTDFVVLEKAGYETQKGVTFATLFLSY
jgi:hypothetical protein